MFVKISALQLFAFSPSGGTGDGSSLSLLQIMCVYGLEEINVP